MYEFLDYLVSDVMSKPTTVGPDASLAEAERILGQTGFNGLPVVDGGALVGFVTSLDLLAAFRFTPDAILPPYDEIMRRPVSSVMAKQPPSCSRAHWLTRVLEKWSTRATRASRWSTRRPSDWSVWWRAKTSCGPAPGGSGERPGGAERE
jgi:CBS domain-containing protein